VGHASDALSTREMSVAGRRYPAVIAEEHPVSSDQTPGRVIVKVRSSTEYSS
jgi:hypothetical protein